jgi:hypothetical protein
VNGNQETRETSPRTAKGRLALAMSGGSTVPAILPMIESGPWRLGAKADRLAMADRATMMPDRRSQKAGPVTKRLAALNIGLVILLKTTGRLRRLGARAAIRRAEYYDLKGG